jgi:hypothetical protein
MVKSRTMRWAGHIAQIGVKLQLLYDWRLTANQFALASSSLRLTTIDLFFFQVIPCSHSPYVTSSLTRRWVCLLLIWPFVQCVYRTYSMLLKNIAFALYTKPLISRGFAKHIIVISCYNSMLVTWTVISFVTDKFKPLTFLRLGSHSPILQHTCYLQFYVYIADRIENSSP